MGRVVALLGGTFDPPTCAHLAVAQEALDHLDADEVWLVPAGAPWQKSPRTSPADRLEMCRLAVAGTPGLAVSTVETDRPGPTLTHETLSQLRRQHPLTRFLFLVGDDVDLSTWASPEECLRLAEFVRMPRQGYTPVPGARRLPAGVGHISSTEVRSRVAAGEPITGLVPPPVEAFIHSRALYSPGAPQSGLLTG